MYKQDILQNIINFSRYIQWCNKLPILTNKLIKGTSFIASFHGNLKNSLKIYLFFHFLCNPQAFRKFSLHNKKNNIVKIKKIKSSKTKTMKHCFFFN